jgi:hypothetical protein
VSNPPQTPILNARKNPRGWLEVAAADVGFLLFGIGPAEIGQRNRNGLAAFLDDGFEGDMGWLRETAAKRQQPQAMWPEAKSAIVLGMNYGPDHNPMDNLAAVSAGNISVYARGRDYHDVVKGKLKQLAGQFAAKTGSAVKVFVDTAPLMEKPLAQIAGLGWQGKHTNLVSRKAGSWLFLGVILTDAVMRYDEPETDHCGGWRFAAVSRSQPISPSKPSSRNAANPSRLRWPISAGPTPNSKNPSSAAATSNQPRGFFLAFKMGFWGGLLTMARYLPVPVHGGNLPQTGQIDRPRWRAAFRPSDPDNIEYYASLAALKTKPLRP